MASVVARRSGGWEIRESLSGPSGPRSRTLASFRVLGPAELERALERAERPLDREQLLLAAQRAGAPVALDPDRASAARLLAGLTRGERVPPRWAALLAELLGGSARDGGAAEADPVSDSERAAAAWADASLERRGEVLRELLLLAERIGPRRPPDPRPGFPGLTFGSG